MTANNPTRRTFVIGVGALLASVACGAVARPLAAEADVLRPPGSVPEQEFMSLCIKCERCTSVCPTGVIIPMGIEGGPIGARSPMIDYTSGRCTFCDKCREVCPTGAVREVDPYAPEKGRIGVAVLHEDRCLAFVQPGSCGICVDACEYEALSFDGERRPVVDESRCNGCGECVRICPANVLTSFSGGKSRGIEVVTEKEFAARGGDGQ